MYVFVIQCIIVRLLKKIHKQCSPTYSPYLKSEIYIRDILWREISFFSFFLFQKFDVRIIMISAHGMYAAPLFCEV